MARRPKQAPVGADVVEFEDRLGHRFRDRDRLAAALVHRSAANERKLAGNYERLEFLGDAVLGMVTAAWLYRKNPDLPKASCRAARAPWCRPARWRATRASWGSGAHLALGQGEERSGGRDKASLLADSLEAVIAAVYLDGGMRAASKVVERFLRASSASLDFAATDAKSELQERIQAGGRSAPVYRVSEESGPDHDKRFTVEVLIDGAVAGRGQGDRRRPPSSTAARRVL